MRTMRRNRTKLSPRRGSTLVFAMIALLVTSLVGASLLRGSFLSMQQVRREQWHVQSNWLAEAGCRRAIHRLGTDAGYRGENWKVSAAELKSPFGATVSIAITEGSAPTTRTITVVAEYPEQETSRYRIRKVLTIGPSTKTE